MGNVNAASRAGRWVAVIVGALAFGVASRCARAQSPPIDTKETISVREVRPGMTGYGLTVFKGTHVERFQFEVLGVLPNTYMGKPLVLIRMSGGPISLRQANMIEGMSGSPCYINGRLLGAYSMSYPWGKDPIGMVSPIEEMWDAFDPKLSAKQEGMSASLEGATPLLRPPDASGAPALGLPGGWASLLGSGGQPRPAALPVTITGLTGANFDRLARTLRPLGLAPQMGAGAKPQVGPVPIGAGSMVGVSLATGDIEMTAFGTVTYRKGDQLLMFGHPFLGVGPIQLPITTAVVYDVFPAFAASFKLVSSGTVVGSTVQDHPFALAGKMGAKAPMIPVTCEVEDKGTGRLKVFRSQIATHPLIMNQLAEAVCSQGVFNVHSAPGDTTAKIALEVKTDDFGTLRRQNIYYGMVNIESAAVDDMAELLRILSSNSFRRVRVRGVTLKVTLEPKRTTAVVDRIFVAKDKYAPGDTVDVGVVLRPFRGEPFSLQTQVRIPQNAAPGRAVLTVSGGPPRPAGGAIVIGPGGATTAAAPPSLGPSTTSVTQMLRRFLERERNDQLVTRITLPSTTVNVSGEKLSLLPSNLSDIMRSSKTTGVRLERDEVRSAKTMENVLTGAQTLQITIERDDHSEVRGASKGSTPTSSSTSSSSPSGTTSGSSSLHSFLADDDEDDREGAALLPDVTLPLPASVEIKKERGRSTTRRSGSSSAGIGSGTVAPGSTESGSAGSTGDNKPVGRTATTWRQTSQADFERGTMKGTAVAAGGDVRLAPILKIVYESPEQYLWSVAAATDAYYAGSGNSGYVYRVSRTGEAKIFFKTGELEVHALARDENGYLYAGTSPNGKVFRIAPDGKGTEILNLNAEGASADGLSTPANGPRFVLALAVGPDGSVYAGTGPVGHVIRIDKDGKSHEILALADKPVQSLFVTPDGTVWAGTAESGLIYAIAPDGHSRVVFDSDQTAITAFARAEDGTLYASTAPKGIVYQIASDGDTRVLWDKAKSAIQALAVDGAGTLYAASGNIIYRIRDRDDITLLTDSARAQFVALCRDPGGSIVAASANVGTLYRLESARSGVYESPVHDAKRTSRWGAIHWSASAPSGTTLQVATRSGNTEDPDATWSDWVAPGGSGESWFVTSPPARYFQYRLTLSTTAEEGPVLRDLTLSYLPRNQAPTISLSAPGSGDLLRGSQPVRWTGADPDRDTLTYDVSVSDDDGKTWKPIGTRIRARGGGAEPKATATVEQPGDKVELRRRIEENLAANPALARYRQQLEEDPDLTDAARAEALRRADQLIAGVGTEAEAKGLPPVTGNGTTTAKTAAGETPGSTRESSISWDTRLVVDGYYRLKVVASDRASNPGDALRAEAISEPVRVANRAPWLYVFKKSVHTTTEGVVTVEGLAENNVALQGAQYRVDGGDWLAVPAADGIWDGPFEAWSLTTTPIGPGRHSFDVKVFDAAGNATVQPLGVTVPTPAGGR
jgi:hypothetical protein